MKHKIYVWCNSCDHEWHVMVAVADDGHCLASHVCSDHCFAWHDMGFDSDWKRESYDKHFGAGNWELEWVERADYYQHKGVQAAMRLNKALAEKAGVV